MYKRLEDSDTSNHIISDMINERWRRTGCGGEYMV